MVGDFDYLDNIAHTFYESDATVPSPSATVPDVFPSGFIDSLSDADINSLAPICIGMDYNANINWIVAGQVSSWPATCSQAGQPSCRRLNILKSFFVKYERKLPALIDDFCTYYAHHQNKTVVFYCDTTALGSNYAVNDQDFRWVIKEEFKRLIFSTHRVENII